MFDGTETELRAEICRVGRSLFARGRVHGTAGNISVRLADGFLITPTDTCLGTLQPDALAKVDADGAPVSGERASKTLALHRRINPTDADAGCVIHTHSTPLVALTLRGAWGGRRHAATHYAVLRDKSRPRAADCSSPAGRPGSGCPRG